MSARILVIDDEESYCEILKYNLEKEGYDVETASSAEEALEMDLSVYNLMIVDIMMEKLSGFDFAKRVRQNPATEFTPIIFCSALNGEDEIVMGLNKGADDYITKPFTIGEVIARVKAVLRRVQHQHMHVAAATPVQAPAIGGHQIAIPQKQEIKVVAPHNYEPDITFKTLRIDRNEKAVYINGKEVSLSRREFDLLLFFLTQPERIHSRDEIKDRIWGTEVTVTLRTIDVTIARLRTKIKPYDANIVTRLGFGYGFRAEVN